ncbi:MAG TPA: hypothetical protein VHC19_16210 [Pirellulales bacterium]|jgi:hypothetical protein|nr:hypothetical protein [Pirellulales bacterium]
MNAMQTCEPRRHKGAAMLIVVGLLAWLGFAMLPDVRRYLRIHSM